MKSRPDLFPPRALALAGEVLAFGDTKHPDEKWRKMSVSDHLGASLRHYCEYQAGNTQDAETKKSHLAHMLVRVAMALEVSVIAEPNQMNLCGGEVILCGKAELHNG